MTGAGVHVSHVVVDGNAGKPGGEDRSAVGVNLGEEEMAESGPCETDVHSADSGEERSAGELTHRPRTLRR